MADTEARVFDATEEFQKYRLLLREIWNQYLWSDESLRDWDMVDHFSRIRPLLFSSLLEERLRRKYGLVDGVSFRIFVVPRIPNQNGVPGAPIRISETLAVQVSRDWMEPPSHITGSDIILEFLDFFDWGQAAFRDLQYFLVKIGSSTKYGNLKGREALVQVDHARVLVAEPGISEELQRSIYERPESVPVFSAGSDRSDRALIQ
jgi:hypothetical protein